MRISVREADCELIVWGVMDESIRTGVTSTEPRLPGGLEVKRRAPGLYKRLQKGFYPTVEVPKPGEGEIGVAKRVGRSDHVLPMVPVRTTPVFPGIEYLSCMAIAVRYSQIRR